MSTGAWDFTRPYLRGLKPLRVFTLPSGTTLNYSHPFYRMAGFFGQDRVRSQVSAETKFSAGQTMGLRGISTLGTN